MNVKIYFYICYMYINNIYVYVILYVEYYCIWYQFYKNVCGVSNGINYIFNFIGLKLQYYNYKIYYIYIY